MFKMAFVLPMMKIAHNMDTLMLLINGLLSIKLAAERFAKYVMQDSIWTVSTIVSPCQKIVKLLIQKENALNAFKNVA